MRLKKGVKNTGHVAAREVRRHDPFCVGSEGEAGNRWGREVGAVRGWLRFEAGSRRAAADSLRLALSSAKGQADVYEGAVPPNRRLRCARCPPSVGCWWGARWERFEAV